MPVTVSSRTFQVKLQLIKKRRAHCQTTEKILNDLAILSIKSELTTHPRKYNSVVNIYLYTKKASIETIVVILVEAQGWKEILKDS